MLRIAMCDDETEAREALYLLSVSYTHLRQKNKMNSRKTFIMVNITKIEVFFCIYLREKFTMSLNISKNVT